jgi:hypothetical protein
MHAIRGQLGEFEPYRDVRERLTTYLHGRLNALTPYIPFTADPKAKD